MNILYIVVSYDWYGEDCVQRYFFSDEESARQYGDSLISDPDDEDLYGYNILELEQYEEI